MWRCSTCDEVHQDLPLAWGSPPPLDLFDVPPEELDDRVLANSDLCVVDGQHFFVRAELELPVRDLDDDLVFAVWVAVDDAAYEMLCDTWEDPARVDQAPLRVWVATELPLYPSTVRLEGLLHQRPPGLAPRLVLDPSPHPLAREQHQGIDRARVQAIAEQLLHAAPVATDEVWRQIREMAAASPTTVELLPCTDADGVRALDALGISALSPLGAVARFSGGLLLDHGWLRILGAGGARLRAIDRWNAGCGFEHGVLIADDVLGGFFAWMNQSRTVMYLAPDTLQWHDLGVGYADWLEGALGGALTGFYAALRTSAPERLPGPNEGVSIYPPLPFGHDGPRDQRTVPIEDLWAFHLDLSSQLRDLPDGAQVRFDLRP